MREYPKSPDAADALVLKAEVLEAAAGAAEAEKTYVKLAADYPDEDEGASALWRLGWIAWFRGDHGRGVPRGGGGSRPCAAGRRCARPRPTGSGARGSGAAIGDEAARQFAHGAGDAPRTYYGILAARARPAPRAARRPASAFALPGRSA